MAKKVSENAIGDVLSDDWGKDASNGLPYSGQAVQDALKGKLSDHEARLKTAEENIKSLQEASGLSYLAYLYYDKSANTDYVTAGGEWLVGVCFCGVRSEGGVSENANINGTLNIEVSTDGGNSYTQRGTVTLTSRDTADDESSLPYTSVDISSYLSSGAQQVRLSVSYEIDGETVTSGTRMIYITLTSLSVTYAGEVTQVWDPTADDALAFKLTGAVARTLHINIEGSSGTMSLEYELLSTEYANTSVTWYKSLTIGTDSCGLLTHGVKTITAWLTCDDGLGGTLSSDKCIVQRMVVADEDDTACYLLLQNLITSATNYVQTTICNYVVYGPSGETVPLVFRLSNYNDDEDYFKMELNVETNTLYALSTTIEIENSSEDSLYAYLHVEDDEGTAMTTVKTITVDNSEKFAPTSGATFVLNPKVRSNSESNPETIVNDATNAEVDSTWSGFGGGDVDRWVEADDGQRVLRILAGQLLTIDYDWLSAFASTNTANVTMELDFKVSNITEEDTPIIYAGETYGSSFIGLLLKPLEGVVYTKSKVTYAMQNFLLKEGERVHMAINIVSALQSSADSSDTVALCRVFLNGVICREFMFDTSSADWHSSGGNLIIGHEHADIDIYGIRCYSKALSTSQVMSDYISTLPTSAEKLAFREANDLLDTTTSLVSVSKCQSLGLNVLIWHGEEPSYYSSGSKTGYWEIVQYDSAGNRLPEYSGTICKASASLSMSGQGTTAKTYPVWNGQTKLKDVTATIQVALTSIHEDITVGEPYTDDNGTWVDLYGCGLGKRDWATNETIRKGGAQSYAYDADTDTVVVPDGWIDGNNKYRGKCYLVGEGLGYGIKLVNKINYASCMQSHLMGSNNAYNDLHQAVVGNVGMQLSDSTARIAKAEKPFMYFTQTDENEAAVFQGMSTFGPGKMDDAQFRFDKKEFPGFVMMEGSDNNLALTDYRTPWESKYISYDLDDGEIVGYKYNGDTSIDLDKFADTTVAVDGVDYEGPTADVEQAIKDFVNFMYLHSPRLKVYVGTWDAFLASDSASETTYKWWCTSGDEAYKLKRYCAPTGEWVDAGWDADTEENVEIDLSSSYATEYSANEGQYAAMNTAFISAIVEDARSGIGDIINVASFKFYYNFVVQFLAGTDNCSKNTYICRVPKYANSGDNTNNGVYTGDYEWVMGQDDMDTIFATDNSGYQNKPYYVDRNNPTSDVSGENVYQGNYNVLCDLLEALYGDSGNGDNVTVTRSILSQMTSKSGDVWSFMEDYFFSTQQYFPALAYNEQARIRYEYWEAYTGAGSDGFTSSRGVRPIAQSLGNQLLAEEQFMLRRIVLFASYAGYGGFSRTNSSALGITDTVDTLGIQGDGSTHTVKFSGLVPHQYMYIGGYIGTTDKYLGTRCKPGESYDFELGETSGDTACALFGAHYFRSFGDLGILSVNSTNTFVLNGNRIMEVTAKDSTTFAPPSMTLNTPLVETVDLTSSAVSGVLNASSCTRLQSLTMTGSGITMVSLPSNGRLQSIAYGGAITSISLVDMAQLESLSIESYDALASVEISGTPAADTYAIAEMLYTTKPSALESVTMKDVAWTDVAADVLVWLTSIAATLTGSVTMLAASSDRYITLAEKMSLVEQYGDIDSSENTDDSPLYVKYTTRAIESVNVVGSTLCRKVGQTYTYSMSVSPTAGNNVAVKDGKLDIAWSIDNTASVYATWDGDFNGELTVTALSDADANMRHTLGVTLGLMDETSVSSSIEVGFFSRTPKVGDFAYGDGTFDSSWNGGADFIGLVYRIDETTTEDGADALLVRIVGTKDITLTDSDNIVRTTHRWGLYPDSNGTNGPNSTIQTAIQEALGLSSSGDVTDIAALTNVTTPGLTSGSSTTYYVSASSYVDETTENGYKAVGSSSAAVDFDGEGHTEKIIAHADDIIKNYLNLDTPTTPKELADAITAVITDGGASWCSEYYYPAAYCCHLYEPSVTNELDEQYAQGNWYLPSIGEMARIYNFYRQGITADDANEEAELEAVTPIFANATARRGETAISFTASQYMTSTELSSSYAWNLDFGSGLMGYGYYTYNGYAYKYCGFYVRPCSAFIFEL